MVGIMKQQNKSVDYNLVIDGKKYPFDTYEEAVAALDSFNNDLYQRVRDKKKATGVYATYSSGFNPTGILTVDI